MKFVLAKEQEKFIPKMVEAITYEEALFVMEGVMDDYRPSGDCEIAFRKALASLEKHIPKKPIPVILGEVFKDTLYKCPCCGDDWNANEYGSAMEYCWTCGQAIDWSEVQE